MKQYIIELRRGLKWKKTWWTVPVGTWPYPVRIPSVRLKDAREGLRRAKTAFPHDDYRIAEVPERIAE